MVTLGLAFCEAFLRQILITRHLVGKQKGVGSSAACHLGRLKWLTAFAGGGGGGKKSSSAQFAFPVPLQFSENNLYTPSKFMKKKGADEED